MGQINSPRRIDLKTCDPATWFYWALGQFNLFDGAPRPELAAVVDDDTARAAVVKWIPRFRRWLNSDPSNTRRRSVARLLLRCWNDALTIKGAREIDLVFGGLDDRNRAGVVAVFSHVRYF